MLITAAADDIFIFFFFFFFFFLLFYSVLQQAGEKNFGAYLNGKVPDRPAYQ